MKYQINLIIFVLSYLFSVGALNNTSQPTVTTTIDYNVTEINNYTMAPDPESSTPFYDTTTSKIDTNSTNSTASLPTTNQTSLPTKQPKTEESALTDCSCDLLMSQCDFNCCCDKECTEEDKELFLNCTDAERGRKRSTVSDKYCIRKEFLFRDNTPYETKITDNGLFCILTDNSKQETMINLPKHVDKLQEAPKYTWPGNPLAPPTSAENRYVYKSRIEILTKNDPEKRLDYFGLPTFFYEKCTFHQPIQFLENSEAHCPITLQNLEHECEELQTLNAKMYIGNFYFIGNPGMSTSFNTTSWNPNLLNASYFQCEESSKFCRSISDLKQPQFNRTQNLCMNILKKLEITFVHNGIQGISSIFANITYKNYSIPEAVQQLLLQEFKVNFEWNQGQFGEQVPASGIPGYIIGKPLILGVPATKLELSSNASSSEIEDESENKTVHSIPQSVIKKDSLTGWYLTVPNPSDCNGLRKNVKFGMNTATTCYLNISNYKSCQELQREIGKVFLGVDPQQFHPRYVSSYGRPDLRNMDNWVEIVGTNNPFGVDQTSSFTLLDNGCGGLITTLNIKILHGLSGSIQFPQPRVAGVLYAYGDPIKLPKRSDTRASKVVITTTVQFYDVTGKTTTLIPKWPVIRIKLPSDFFYPFSSVGTRTSKIFTSLLMVCTFLTNFLN